jgi:hypothetical protein
MEMCDLLEVYSSSEKETLKRTHGVYMKESDLARSIAATAASEETLQFVDMDTLRYQKIASQKVETIRLMAEKRKSSNNVIEQSAFYSDIESDDDNESNDDNDEDEGDVQKCIDNSTKNKSKISSSQGECDEESEEEEEPQQQQSNWNRNKKATSVYKGEIDVDDI